VMASSIHMFEFLAGTEMTKAYSIGLSIKRER
jgi:hypothetical protein